MDDRNLDRALDIVTRLLGGEEISKKHKENVTLYEEYINNSEVYGLVQAI